jgi:hypothetical protein
MPISPTDRQLLVRESIATIKQLANTPHDAGVKIAEEIGGQVEDIDRIAGNKTVSQRCRALMAAVEGVYLTPVENTPGYIRIRSDRRVKLYNAIQELEASLRSVGLLAA